MTENQKQETKKRQHVQRSTTEQIERYRKLIRSYTERLNTLLVTQLQEKNPQAFQELLNKAGVK